MHANVHFTVFCLIFLYILFYYFIAQLFKPGFSKIEPTGQIRPTSLLIHSVPVVVQPVICSANKQGRSIQVKTCHEKRLNDFCMIISKSQKNN